MTDEMKRVVDALRMCPVLGYRCNDCPVYTPGKPCQNELNAADLIESLAAELEQLEAERDSALSLIGKLAVILRSFPHADAKECASKAYNAVKNWMLFDMKKLAEPPKVKED